MKRRAVFLDRDGVINKAFLKQGCPHPPSSCADLEILPGVPESLSLLRKKGFLLIVVTNQPDVARGTMSQEIVEAINQELQQSLGFDAILNCFHDDQDKCLCRKPQPGLLKKAAQALSIDLAKSYMVGDRWKDIEAGKSAGCKTFFIDYGYQEKQPVHFDHRVKSLLEAAKIILKETEKMKSINHLKVKIFADGADKTGMIEMYSKPFIKGLTTNPTLMKAAGITDYKVFAQDILKTISSKPISFEVFSDDFKDMERQALEIASWGPNVYVKIPVTNTKQQPTYDLVNHLSTQGVKVNVTAIMTLAQTRNVVAALAPQTPSYVSIFAGRIADTGKDPLPLMAAAVELLRINPQAELIWASPREFLNIFQAETIGCHIITITNDLLKRLTLFNKNLDEYSLETVKMFYNDAKAAGFAL